MFEVLNDIKVFFEEESNGLAHKFKDNSFLMKLAYLSDMFQKLNEHYVSLIA